MQHVHTPMLGAGMPPLVRSSSWDGEGRARSGSRMPPRAARSPPQAGRSTLLRCCPHHAGIMMLLTHMQGCCPEDRLSAASVRHGHTESFPQLGIHEGNEYSFSLLHQPGPQQHGVLQVRWCTTAQRPVTWRKTQRA